jgi:hypothetical protein
VTRNLNSKPHCSGISTSSAGTGLFGDGQFSGTEDYRTPMKR